jgi:peroxiredoxin
MNSFRHRCVQIAALALLLGAAHAAEPPAQTLTRLDPPFPAPDFTLTGEDGKTYRLADYRGKVVVLNFWATWCPPCRYEMPSMERAHQKTRGENIVLLAVNVGETADQVFEFTGHYPVSFPLPLDLDGAVLRRYPVIGLPTTFVIDPRGLVTHRAIGGREWDDERLLAELRKLLKP